MLDSPNNVELDDGERQELFDYLFKNVDRNTQLIVSTLGFSAVDYPDIEFDNNITDREEVPGLFFCLRNFAKGLQLHNMYGILGLIITSYGGKYERHYEFRHGKVDLL